MADEAIKPNPSPQEVESLKESVRKLEANNKALMEQYAKAQEKAKAVPPDVDVNALIAFKQQKEQEELEAKGRYEEAIAKQAQQYRQAEEAKNKKIADLEARQRQLEVEAPAVTALADVVHDPQYVLSRISKDQLSREADGTVVVVDGYNRTNVKDWAMSNMPQWVQKNPFAKESFNLTEQSRLYKTDINKYNMLKNAVSG